MKHQVMLAVAVLCISGPTALGQECASDDDCPVDTPGRDWFCNDAENACEYYDTPCGCINDSDCPGEKCRPGICDALTECCVLGPWEQDCCTEDAQCPSESCRQGWCDLATNTCQLRVSCESDGDPCTVERCDENEVCQVYTPGAPEWPIADCPPEAAYYLAVVGEPTPLPPGDEVDDKALPPCGAQSDEDGDVYVEIFVTEMVSELSLIHI